MSPIKEVNIPVVGAEIASILGVGADIVSQGKYRTLLPDFYEDHAGNFGLTWCLVVVTNILGKLIERRGSMDENHLVKEIGEKIQTWGTILAVGINIGVESQFINNINLLKANSGDFAVGLIAIAVGAIVGNNIGKWVENKTTPDISS
jgi:hypothetical protein